MIKTGAFQKLKVLAVPQESILVVTRFVFSSCEFVDGSFIRKTTDPQSHTNQHEQDFRLELDVTFEAKSRSFLGRTLQLDSLQSS